MTQATAEEHSRRLVALQPEGDTKPLFVFPGIHGTPETFADFAARLSTETVRRPVYGFRHVGSQRECDPVRQVSRLAQLYAAEMRSVQPRGPYYLFGYALGGVIAFEVARELRGQAERVGLVIMADCPAPSYPQPAPVWMRARTHLQNLWNIPRRQRGAYLRERLNNGVIRAGKLVGFTPESPQTAPDQPVPEHQQGVDAALYEAYQYYKLTPQCVDVLFLTADTPPELADGPVRRSTDGLGPSAARSHLAVQHPGYALEHLRAGKPAGLGGASARRAGALRARGAARKLWACRGRQSIMKCRPCDECQPRQPR